MDGERIVPDAGFEYEVFTDKESLSHDFLHPADLLGEAFWFLISEFPNIQQFPLDARKFRCMLAIE